MIFPLVAALVFLAPTVLLALIGIVVQLVRRRPLRGWLRAMGWLNGGLLVLHAFVTFPLVLGWFGVHGFGAGGQFTRGDERAYRGPRIAADGSWQVQDRVTLKAEAGGAVTVDPALDTAAAARAVTITGADGNALRAFRVAAPQEPPRAVVILVHGLFRSAMEVEPPAAMLRKLGCECWLLDQRGHGGSTALPLRFDDSQARDLVAAVRHVRAQPGHERLPLVLFGVSIGTVAVSLALPQLGDVSGVVLDAPVDDLLSTAHRMLQLERPGDRRSFFALYEPWRSLVLTAMELWSGCTLADVAPARVLTGLPSDLPMLIVGGGEDDKVPPAVVQRLYDSLPMATGTKELWIDAAAGHGNAWLQAPVDYERHLAALLQRLRPLPPPSAK